MALPTALVSIGTVLEPRAYVADARLDLASLLLASSVPTVDEDDQARSAGGRVNETLLSLRDLGATHVNVSLLGVLRMRDAKMDLRANGTALSNGGFVRPRWRFGFGSRATGEASRRVRWA